MGGLGRTTGAGGFGVEAISASSALVAETLNWAILAAAFQLGGNLELGRTDK